MWFHITHSKSYTKYFTIKSTGKQLFAHAKKNNNSIILKTRPFSILSNIKQKIQYLLNKKLNKNLVTNENKLNDSTKWTSEDIIYSGDEYVSRLCEDIKNSNDTIDMEVYIIEDDAYANRVLRELSNAAKRGVHVRLLVDGFGRFMNL